uniref:Uncharacterized protein n=1 Tax=Opuntia streptacantha TaxID=393608 RepID=A0A7C8Z115_OPUST
MGCWLQSKVWDERPRPTSREDDPEPILGSWVPPVMESKDDLTALMSSTAVDADSVSHPYPPPPVARVVVVEEVEEEPAPPPLPPSNLFLLAGEGSHQFTPPQ